MAPNTAFVNVTLEGSSLHVSGHSTDLGVKIDARYVMIKQGDVVVAGAASPGLPSWAADLTPTDGLVREKEALAVGIEVFFDESTATFATLTWSQEVRIT